MKDKHPKRKHTPKYGYSSKKRIRRKGVSDTEGNYDLDGISQDENFDVIVASEKDPHARHPNEGFAAYLKTLKNKVADLFKH